MRKSWTPIAWTGSGSRGLDQLVDKLQTIPLTQAKKVSMGDLADFDTALDTAVGLVERIAKISPDSPGAESKDSALSIGWAVIGWLQDYSMGANEAFAGTGKMAKGYATLSLDGLKDVSHFEV